MPVEPSKNQTFRSGLASRVAVALAALTVTLAVCEPIARWLYPKVGNAKHVPDPVVGFRLTPNQRTWSANAFGEFGVWFTTNSQGNPDVERSVEKPNGTYRIAVIGDSMVQGAQVRPQERFTSLLELQLEQSARDPKKRIEVLNFGSASYGTAQEWLYFKSHVKRYVPDLVLLVLLPDNDVRNNSFQLEVVESKRPEISPFFHVNAQGELVLKDQQFYANALARQSESSKGWRVVRRNLREHLGLFRMFAQAYSTLSVRAHERDRSEDKLDPQTRVTLELFHSQTQKTAEKWLEAWKLTSVVLSQFRQDVIRSGAKFHVAIATGPWAIYPESRKLVLKSQHREASYDWEFPHRRAERMLSDLGVQFTSLLPAVREGARGNKALMHFLRDGHYTPEGHRVVTAALLPVLQSYLSQ